VPPSVGGGVPSCPASTLRQRSSLVCHTAFENRYAHDAGEDGFPAYLQARVYLALRESGGLDRLHLHTGSIFDQAKVLASASGAFDLISISNIADWMDDRQFGEIVGQMRECLTPGGALLARTATGSSMIIDVMNRLLRSEVGFYDELARVERGPWFRTLAAGFRD
jgi:S-adenosylmethionine:diacylglycerol 3-amino-3-carboxypropyl transferase